MAARRHRGAFETPEEIALFHAREEALEALARRRLLEEEVRLARQRRSRDRVDLGHRRLALIERATLGIISLVTFVTSLALLVLGAVSPAIAQTSAALSGVGVASRGNRVS